MKITFDTTTKPDDEIVILAEKMGWHVAYASVSLRETRETDFELQIMGKEIIP